MIARRWLGSWLAVMLLACAVSGFARDCPHAQDPSPLIAPPAATDVLSVEVFFSPWDDAQQRLLQVLADACEQVLVQAFVLTSRDVADGLVAARQRGVDVRVLADARQHADTPASLLPKLVKAGIPVWLEDRYRHAHNKVMLIDVYSQSPIIVTGSYNFTWSAQHRNAENLLIIRGHSAIADRYAKNWARHQSDATPLTVLP